MSKYKLGYARVSTLDQDPTLQHDALTAAGCARVFVDKASGTLESRPALDDLLEQARPGDTVVVWRLDRLGRSLKHLIETVQDLDQRGVAFVSLTDNIDTSTPGDGWCSMCSAPWRSSSATSSASARWPGSWPPVPAAGPVAGPPSRPRTSSAPPGRCARAATTTSPASPRSSASAEPRCTGPWTSRC